MKHQILYPVYCIIFVLIIAGCSKYDEGPILSLRSPEKRLLGLWEISELKVDDVDYISTYRVDSIYVRFSIVKYDNTFINIVKDSRSGSQFSSSVLTLEENKTMMRFGLPRYIAYEQYTEGMYNLVPPLESDNDWTIVKLKSEEFIIELMDGDVDYRLTFNKLEKY